MMIRLRPFIAGLAIVWCGAHSTSAQTLGNSAQRRSGIDSVWVRFVMSGVFGALGDDLARAAVDTTVHAWKLGFPPSDSTTWEPYRKYLLLAVRGREATKGDSVFRTLSIGPIEMHRDTLVGRFYLGVEWRCKGRALGAGTGYETRVIRYAFDNAWGGAVTKAVEFGDSAGCI